MCYKSIDEDCRYIYIFFVRFIIICQTTLSFIFLNTCFRALLWVVSQYLHVTVQIHVCLVNKQQCQSCHPCGILCCLLLQNISRPLVGTSYLLCYVRNHVYLLLYCWSPSNASGIWWLFELLLVSISSIIFFSDCTKASIFWASFLLSFLFFFCSFDWGFD